MTAKISFTKTALLEIAAPVKTRQYVYDAKVAGLTLCITPKNTRTFYLCRRVGGRFERIRLGVFPLFTVEQARAAAVRLSGKIAEGENPNSARRAARATPTLGSIYREYIAAPTRGKTKRPRSATTLKNYRQLWKAYLEPWDKRQLLRITRADIERLHNKLGEANGHYTANRVLSLLKALFNHAITKGHVPANPAARLPAFDEPSRDRFLQPDELPAFWGAVEAEAHGDFFKMLLLTGARKENVLHMRWEELDLPHALWRIPKTKAGQPLTLPLSPEALELLTTRERSSPWVFPWGKDPSQPMPPPNKTWERIVKAAILPGLRMHDLRRTLGSWQARAGVSEAIIGRSLGHTSGEATKIYARLDLTTVRRSVEAATAALVAATKPKPPAE